MATSMRVDLYIRPHKAIRSALYQAAIRVGTLDASQPAGVVQEALISVKSALQQLIDHGRHEDAFVHPLYKERIPSAALARLEKDHMVHEQKLHLLKASTDELAGAVSNEGLARLYKNINNFIASYLEHLELEESQLSLLWASYSDEELMHLLECFKASEGDKDAVEQVASFWADLSATEARRLETGMKQNASQEAFSAIKRRLDLSN